MTALRDAALPAIVTATYRSVGAIQRQYVPSYIREVRTEGFTNAGDGGDASYRRVAAEPAHSGKVQSRDGAWWEKTTALFDDARQYGVVLDDSTDNATGLLLAAADDPSSVRLTPGIARTLTQINNAIFVGPGQIREGTLAADIRAPFHVRVTEKVGQAAHTGFDRFSGGIKGPFHASTFLMSDDENVADSEPDAYRYWPEYAQFHSYFFIENGVGYNQNVDQNGPGRTCISPVRIVMSHNGDGDASCISTAVTVSGNIADQEHWLAGGAGANMNGDCRAGADHTYLNSVEMHVKDNGFDVAGIGYVLSMTRTVTTAAQNETWQGFRVQSKDQPIDVGFTVSGNTKIVLDCVTADPSDAAIALAPTQRIALGATASLDNLYGGTARWYADDDFDAAYIEYTGTRTVLGINDVDVFQVSADHVRVQTGADAQRGVRVFGDSTSQYGALGQAGDFAYLSAVAGPAESNGLGFVVTNSGSTSTPLSIAASGNATFQNNVRINGNVGFYNTAPSSKPTVSGSHGSNAALQSFLSAMATIGLITNSTTA